MLSEVTTFKQNLKEDFGGGGLAQGLARKLGRSCLQEYLAHKKQPPPHGTTICP